ncbi:YheC/YheD family protein [Paenibacillus sp. J23TS9]|uniref:YheC/YheD family protein n=1 Tax=Paenibacillus sp. J23TS9 TaxID=2807193 RepID=UPI001BCDA01E|nr:YheC/YheD family protein [Paenibacillus sp. J23TS9]
MQYRILRNGSSLAGRLPDTRLLKKNALSNMLLQYRSVVLKPRDGSYGRDIVFIHRNGANTYRVQNEKNTVTMRDTNQLLKELSKINKGYGYIVQRRLQLAQVGHKPFDIRIMVQRKKGSSSTWNVTGSYAKVAAQGYLVTNVTSRPIPVLEALKLARIGDRSLLVKAEQIALLAAKRLGERYPTLRQVGFDIGIDRNRRIWIIEGNYQPDLRPFRLLKDSSMHRRILWYKQSIYRRTLNGDRPH